MFARKLNKFVEYADVDLREVAQSELADRVRTAVELVFPAVEERTAVQQKNV